MSEKEQSSGMLCHNFGQRSCEICGDLQATGSNSDPTHNPDRVISSALELESSAKRGCSGCQLLQKVCQAAEANPSHERSWFYMNIWLRVPLYVEIGPSWSDCYLEPVSYERKYFCGSFTLINCIKHIR
jgi:hypothetical protein